MTIRMLVLCLVTMILAGSCGKDQLETDIDLINDYLDANGLTAERTSSGLHYIIEEEGVGTARPVLGSIVTVDYKGYFLDGTVFDESEENEPIVGTLGNFVEGWNEGMQLFKRGGKGKLFLPSRIAYGSAGVGDIPGNTVIAFDVELIDF